MSTPRTDAQAGCAIANQYGQSTARELLAAHDGPFVHAVFARTLERELNAERDKAELYRLVTLKLDAKLAAEREKVRVLRSACESICEEWGRNHDANPIGAGQRMATRAGKALEATEDAP